MASAYHRPYHTMKQKKKAYRHTAAHPGFTAVQASIAKTDGVSSMRAGAMLGAASRHASANAKRANPRLNRVKA